jgi:hypothetical protein
MITSVRALREPSPDDRVGGSGGSTASTGAAGARVSAGKDPYAEISTPDRNLHGATRAVAKDSGKQRNQREDSSANRGEPVSIDTTGRKISNLLLDHIRPLRDIQALAYDLFRKPGDVTASGGWGTYLTAIKCDLKAIGKGFVAGAIGGGLAFIVTSGAPVAVGVVATLFVANWAYRITSQHERVKMVKELGSDQIKKTFWGREVLTRSPIQFDSKNESRTGGRRTDTPRRKDRLNVEQGSASQGSREQGIKGQGQGDGAGSPDPNRRFGP